LLKEVHSSSIETSSLVLPESGVERRTISIRQFGKVLVLLRKAHMLLERLEDK
jgi:hypothetical protein